MQIMQRLRKQRGSITLLGVASIVLSLFAFTQVTEYVNAKILDRELDNYARDVASVALRSELAITSGMDNKQITGQTVDDLLAQLSMYTASDGTNTANLTKTITFGNFAVALICNSTDPVVRKGCFIPLVSGANNPKNLDPVPDFSAVAVQLSSTDSFYNYTPQGKALYGLSETNTKTDSGCYCKNRYNSCVSIDLTTADLAALPTAEAVAVAVKGSDARKNYCRFGFTDSKISNLSQTKYPHLQLEDPWVGRPPSTSVNMFDFFSTSASGSDAALYTILNHQPLAVVDGEDPFGSGGSGCFCLPSSSSELFAYQKTTAVFETNDITPSANISDYRCLKSGIISSSVRDCSSSSYNNRDVLLSDSVYVGYEGVCVAATSALDASRCLSYDDSGTTRYDSCLDIERNGAATLNFFQRMMAFFFGPFLNWERSYEALNCEMQKMQYKGGFFWGGWV